jgi:hypothetical protein
VLLGATEHTHQARAYELCHWSLHRLTNQGKIQSKQCPGTVVWQNICAKVREPDQWLLWLGCAVATKHLRAYQ